MRKKGTPNKRSIEWWKRKPRKLSNRKKDSILSNYVYQGKWVSPILIRNSLTVAPMKKVKFEEQADVSNLAYNTTIIAKNLNNKKKVT